MEILRPRIRTISFLLACGLGVAACGNSGPEKPVNRVETETEGRFKVKESYQDGQLQSYVENLDGVRVGYIYSYCQGKDLREISDVSRGGGSDRVVDHPACADGKLTPQDFTIPK